MNCYTEWFTTAVAVVFFIAGMLWEYLVSRWLRILERLAGERDQWKDESIAVHATLEVAIDQRKAAEAALALALANTPNEMNEAIDASRKAVP